MKQKFHYATVTEATEKLQEQGFNLNLSLEGNHLKANNEAYPADDFEIVDLYRYEGVTDPADEATVYALASAAGQQGILITGYGYSADAQAEDVLKQLHYKYQQKNEEQ
jgi:hypothetical protein